MLILGGQVLVGFSYQAVFQPRFARLPALSQKLHLFALILLLAGLAVAMAPAARDRLVECGNPSAALYRFATFMIGWGLLPFAIGVGISLYVTVRIVAGEIPAMAVGWSGLILALFFWCGVKCVSIPAVATAEENDSMELKDKISHALTEARMVLPGVQAMLGFQLIAMLTDSFERLPKSSQYVHLVSLVMTGFTTVMLIAPAAYHRLVERGEATEKQHRVTTRFLLAAMVTLPPGITGDLFVVFRKVMNSTIGAVAVSSAALMLFYGCWFVPGLYLRSRRQRGAT